MERPSHYPFVLYQSVELGLNFETESIQGVCTLWLGFKEDIAVGSTFNLHCRSSCQIAQVLINGAACDYVHNDALQQLCYDKAGRTKFLGEEVDVNYRAALEVARVGELALRITKDVPARMDKPKPLPLGVPRDVVLRFEKLLKIHEHLGPQEDKRRNNMDDLQLLLQEASKGDAPPDYGRIIEVKIMYRLGGGSVGVGGSGFTAGYVFRSPYVDPDVASPPPPSSSSSSSSKMACCYTLGGMSGPLRDLDGVRCWLPCLDSPDQRAVFDITIHAPSQFQILTCGKKVSTVLSATPPSQKQAARPGAAPSSSSSSSSSAAATAAAARGSYFAAAMSSSSSGGSGSSKSTSNVPLHLQPLEHCFAAHGTANPVTREIVTARYFTVTRLAAMSVGFFVGTVEKYKMPLYKTVGRFWVALNLNDTAPSTAAPSRGASQETFGNAAAPTATVVIAGPARRSSVSIGRARSSSIGSVDDAADDGATIIATAAAAAGATKKRKLDGGEAAAPEQPTQPQPSQPQSSQPQPEGPGEFAMPALPSSFPRPVGTLSGVKRSHAAAAAAAAAAGGPSATATRASSMLPPSAPPISVSAERRLLYEDRVRHTTLGLDLSLRQLHKFAGHRLDHDLYTQVFVHDLEADSGEGRGFFAFDGFSLVDASMVLHGEDQVYAETAAHTAQLTAYLYSWLKSALPVDSFDAEFIVHGAVGYLVGVYVETVYGEEDARYRYQKLLDSVLELEKAGKGRPLAGVYPEPYDVYTPHFRQYLLCKSTVLFHLLENNVGGKDPMRVAFKQILRSPLLHNSARRWGPAGPGGASSAEAGDPSWAAGMPPSTPAGTSSDPGTPHHDNDFYPMSGSSAGYQGYGYSPRPQASPFIPPTPNVVGPSPLIPPSPFYPASSGGNPYGFVMPPQYRSLPARPCTTRRRGRAAATAATALTHTRARTACPSRTSSSRAAAAAAAARPRRLCRAWRISKLPPSTPQPRPPAAVGRRRCCHRAAGTRCPPLPPWGSPGPRRSR
jgi:hypothetical protein